MSWDARKAGVRVAESLAVAAIYFAAGRVGLAVPFTNANVSPLWPAAGIALGSLLIFGLRVWPGIALGAFLVDAFTPIPHLTAMLIAIGTTLGPVVAAALLRGKLVPPIQRLTDIRHLILLGWIGPAISASIGASSLWLAGQISGSGLASAMGIWAFGDLLGVFLLVPLLFNVQDFKLTRPRLVELGLLMICLLAGSELLFRQSAVTGAVFGFLLLPFVIWGAVRFSIGGAALASLVVSGFAVWETARGEGPFLAYGTLIHHVQAMQVFIAVTSLSGLCLAAVIAERTKAEAALAREARLRRAQEQYRNIVETTNDGVWMIDGDFRTTFVNARMAEMLGYTPAEMLGRQPFDFLFPEDVARKQADLERRKQGVREVFYTRYRKKDGSELWAVLSASPFFSSKGKFVGALAMHSDVTLLRKTEETLRRNEKLITAGRLAASISHEVNNPLEAVINLLYLLKLQPMNDQSRQYVTLAEKEILRVSAISKRTLGFFRDQSARTELPLPPILDDTVSFYEHELAAHGVKVVRDYRAQGLVLVSQGEMQQVFANLISNALDAMKDGGRLTLRVSEEADHDHPGVRVEVEDTGAGIPDSDMEHLFEPFFTTKPSTGTGLGLWVAKEIVEKHGGAITVCSQREPGNSGTQFSIFLPRAVAAHAVA
ncbi:MAG TPA: MASE1 domain-containing protein [Candidatus Angelobacter sp.]|nr:MASE1 domain-containing protein [Candidatus Angelobacter sp.]